jgi:hypothetical protein
MNMNKITDTAKNLSAVFIGFAIAILLVIFIDKTFGWYMDVDGNHSTFFPLTDDPDGLGWTIRVNSKKELQETNRTYSLTRKKVRDGKTIFDATYNFDALYRRLVPGQPDENADKFIIFFGGSQTFGEGLNDWETIPALVQKDTLSHRVYNYAYSGYGPHQMLRKLETNTLQNEVTETQGIAFYQYFTFHIPRVLGTMGYINWAGGAAPYYHVNSKDQLEYSGSFATGRFFKTLFYWLLGKSAIAKYYQVDLPSKISPSDYDLVCRVLVKSRDIFIDQFPDSRFVVILGLTTSKNDTFIVECLEENLIEYVDLRKLNTGEKDLAFPHDDHFTPKATRLIAEQLVPVVYQ